MYVKILISSIFNTVLLLWDPEPIHLMTSVCYDLCAVGFLQWLYSRVGKVGNLRDLSPVSMIIT